MTTRSLTEIAELCGAVLERADLEGIAKGATEVVISGAAALHEAGPEELSFLANSRYRSRLETTRAGAVLVEAGIETPRRDLVLLRCKNPNAAFSKVIALFAAAEPKPLPGVHASAVIDPSAELGPDVSIGPHCVLGPGATLGARVQLQAGVVLGEGTRVGSDTVLFPHVTIYPGVTLGERCRVHAGAVIGADGHGFEPSPEGWIKVPQCGTVVIEDDVEIGANSTIDRARFGATRVRRGAKIDNLVHLAHNVQVGEGAMIVAQVGVAGSASIGKGAVLGGQVGVSGHLEVGDGARVAGQAGVFGDIEGGVDYFGFPARPHKEALKVLAHTHRLPRLVERLRRLEQRLAPETAPESPVKGPRKGPKKGSGTDPDSRS